MVPALVSWTLVLSRLGGSATSESALAQLGQGSGVEHVRLAGFVGLPVHSPGRVPGYATIGYSLLV